MKKVLAITGYRSDYTKLKSVLKEIDKHEKLNLEVVVFGTHVLDDYGNTIEEIKKDNHKIIANLFTNVEGSNTVAMSKSIGLAIIELSSILAASNPDVVLLVGDRYEIIAAALTATTNNIPVAHIQGGEISGTIDEVLRHSITKMSHIHFPSTELSKKRIIKMGENPNFVFNVGCPAIDHISELEYLQGDDLVRMYESLDLNLGIDEKYIMLIQHPVTTDYKNSGKQITTTLESLQHVGVPVLMVYPNPDAGSQRILSDVRKFSRKHRNNSVICWKGKHIEFSQYLNLLKNCQCLVGNSSSGIREAHFYAVPAINIGDRQDGRERTPNIIDVPYDKFKIAEAIMENMGKRIYDERKIYGVGNAGKQIAKILSELDLHKALEKRLFL